MRMHCIKILRGVRFKFSDINKRYLSKDSQDQWQSVVGLEVHAQLNTKSKLFSGSENTFGGVVNNCVSLFDAAVPGTLPVLNRKCVELGILTALALSCKINEVSTFDRKHYFYADLPAGYQITQQQAPLAYDGVINFQVFTPGVHKKPYTKSSKIKQIQLEQDSGKSLHDVELKRSLVDLNRAGAPLIELVFEPDLEDGEEAAALVKELVLIVQRLGACSGRMEEGALRVDANVSLRRGGAPGARTEVKNLGSVRALAAAVRYELRRQRARALEGRPARPETRAWDAAAARTVPLRDKDLLLDYRFMPEPNLPPLRVNLSSEEDAPDAPSVPRARRALPELPAQTRARLERQFGLRPAAAAQLVGQPPLLELFLGAAEGRDPARLANLLLNELLAVLHAAGVDAAARPLPAARLGELADLLAARELDAAGARGALRALLRRPTRAAREAAAEGGWLLQADEAAVARLCAEVVAEHPRLAAQFRAGKRKVLKALLGALRERAGPGGRPDMALAARLMERLLGE